jgi:hypothetical protein
MSTFLTQKGTLGIKKLTRDQIVEILPPPITNESLASDLGETTACAPRSLKWRIPSQSQRAGAPHSLIVTNSH